MVKFRIKKENDIRQELKPEINPDILLKSHEEGVYSLGYIPIVIYRYRAISLPQNLAVDPLIALRSKRVQITNGDQYLKEP